ncbi:hypothetical protein GCM10023169_24100 [Georgenia halophila]|uniref:Cytochrome P450 n=1 Tax=Georgenia halophila TaxID=620889 RepID=A0ABP8LAB2_9MICO
MAATDVPPVPYPTKRTLFDPPEELAEYRGEAPIRPLVYPDGPHGWLVTSHELTRQVLGDDRFSMKESPRFIARSPSRGPDDESLRPYMEEALRPARPARS